MMDVSASEACVRGGLCESVHLCAFMKDRQKKGRESEMTIHTGTTTRLSLQDLTDLFVVEILNHGGSNIVPDSSIPRTGLH